MNSEPEKARDRSRRRRAESTDAERRLWVHLRAKRFSGFKFRRQHPIGPYFADFCCVARLLVIEIDGSQHAEEEGLTRMF
jgi:very-short-patch-repair endonuclease